MTLDEIKTIRDKYYEAIVAADLNQLNHSIDGASYEHDAHRESLQKSFEYYDALYNRKLSGGQTRRLSRKAV